MCSFLSLPFDALYPLPDCDSVISVLSSIDYFLVPQEVSLVRSWRVGFTNAWFLPSCEGFHLSVVHRHVRAPHRYH